MAFQARPMLTSSPMGPAPQAQAPSPVGPMTPQLEFRVKPIEGNGEEGSLTSDDLLQQLAAAGYAPLGMSADGSMVTLQDQGGTYVSKVDDIFKTMGQQITHAAPINAEQIDTENVNAGWRAAVHKLPDDNQRKRFLEMQLRDVGITAPHVMGSGRDWYTYNPETDSWIALTNSPDWDSSDLAEGGLDILRAGAATAGGFGGAVGGAGVASIPGAMGGAALGGFGMDAAQRGVIGAMYPNYMAVARENVGSQMADLGKSAAVDALTAGIPLGAAKYAPKLAGAMAQSSPKVAKAISGAGRVVDKVFNNGLVSRGGQAVGRGAQAVGETVRDAAAILDNPIGRELATLNIPGAAEADVAGMILQAPKGIATTGAELLGAAGERIPGRIGQKMVETSKNLLRRRPPSAAQLAEEQGTQAAADMAAKVAGQAPKQAPLTEFVPDARTVVGNAFQRGTARVKQAYHRARGNDIRMNVYREQRRLGVPPADAKRIADEAVQDLGRNAGALGEQVGKAFDRAAVVGENVGNASRKVAGGVIRGARAGGEGTRRAGLALERLSTVAKPLENRFLADYGAEEISDPYWEQANPWRQRPPRATMNKTQLAAQ